MTDVPLVSELVKYSRLALDLRWFLKRSISLEESKKVIVERLRHRTQNFVHLIKNNIYGNPDSPYLKLLELAGCEYGDVETLVNREGLEGALHKLLAAGVYFRWEEFKGKREVVRGSRRFQFREADFDNPHIRGYYQVQSSGSRSTGTRTMFDLGHQLEKNYYHLPMLAVNDALEAPIGLWQPELPSIAGIGALLHYWNVGKPVARWFSPVTEGWAQSLRDRLAMKYIIYGGRLWGASLAKPEHVNLTEVLKVAQWMAKTKKEFGGCSLNCFVSPAVKVCQAAIENGLDIRGTRFFVAGEPLTEAKRRRIEAAGARVTPRYHIAEIGAIGCGCDGSQGVDDVHLFSDCVALIQCQRKVEHSDMMVNAFLFTSLWPSAPRIFLNVESDDYGVIETGLCGCLFEELGFTKHLRNIRSFAKLTGSGMTIIGSDFIRILEEVLPRRYGGVATDYQLIEEEDTMGQTRLSLIVSPTVGVLDENDVIVTVISELRQGIHGGKLAAEFWSEVDIIRIKREYPVSSFGKISTLHLTRDHKAD